MAEDIILGLCIPLGICVVLPVLIVWFFIRAKINDNNNRSEIILKAIEANPNTNVDEMVKSLSSSATTKTPREILNLRLLRGCMFGLIGVIGEVSTMLVYRHERMGALILGLISGIFLAIGIAYLIVYFVSKKTIDKDEPCD